MSLKNFSSLMDSAVQLESGDASFLQQVLHSPEIQEDRAKGFDREAAERIKPVPDVAGTFQRLAKKRKARREKLDALS
jgi:predicted transposase YbfD/YdcC